MYFFIYFSCITEDFSSLVQEAHFFSRCLFQKKKKKSQYQNNHILLRKLNIFYFRSIFRGEKTAHRGARALNSFLILHLV